MKAYFKNSLMLIFLFFLMMGYSCMFEELLSGKHEVVVENSTKFTIKDFKMKENVENSASDFTRNELQVGESVKSPLNFKSENYELTFKVSDKSFAKTVKLEKKNGKVKHTITFSGDSVEKVSYKLNTETKSE